MPSIETALQWAINVANNPKHGYDQINRYGPDYDCSSLICTALKTNGFNIGGATYTGNMRQELCANGWTAEPYSAAAKSKLRRGDIVLNTLNHVVWYLGNNQIVHARKNEKGGSTGGKTGDQGTPDGGEEIGITPFYEDSRGWNYVLHPPAHTLGGPEALKYNYYAGHPLFFGGPGKAPHRTGAWTIIGGSGSFIVTASKELSAGKTVYGSSAAFGTVAFTNNLSALISFYDGVTPYQTVVDPKTGNMPAGNGRITGIMPTREQLTGKRVGKMGASGWTEGDIVGERKEGAALLKCANFPMTPEDLGAPLWRSDEFGLRAVGMLVAENGWYLPIEDLMQTWDGGKKGSVTLPHW